MSVLFLHVALRWRIVAAPPERLNFRRRSSSQRANQPLASVATLESGSVEAAKTANGNEGSSVSVLVC